jgi:hypothetical protein
MRKLFIIALFVLGVIFAAAKYFGLLREEFTGTAEPGRAERWAVYAHHAVGVIAALLGALILFRMLFFLLYLFIRG